MVRLSMRRGQADNTDKQDGEGADDGERAKEQIAYHRAALKELQAPPRSDWHAVLRHCSGSKRISMVIKSD